LQAAAKVLAEAKANYDIVLIDTPALLRVADATEIVGAADAAVIVISPEEPIRDHYKMAERLRLVEAEVAGYIYLRTSMPSALSIRAAALFDRARIGLDSCGCCCAGWLFCSPPPALESSLPQPVRLTQLRHVVVAH
jgi:hypothetical protein